MWYQAKAVPGAARPFIPDRLYWVQKVGKGCQVLGVFRDGNGTRRPGIKGFSPEELKVALEYTGEKSDRV
jgi:hypothetical protein